MTSIKKLRREGYTTHRVAGSWTIRYEGSVDSYRKRKRKYETVKGSKKDPQKELRQRLQERYECKTVGIYSQVLKPIENPLQKWKGFSIHESLYLNQSDSLNESIKLGVTCNIPWSIPTEFIN
jgi:hypothetical protein